MTTPKITMYYGITGWNETEFALLYVERINGQLADEIVCQIFTDQESATKEMNMRNQRLHASVLREYGITTVS